MSYAIEIEGLRKVYSKRGRADVVAVEDLNLNVSRGQVFGFLGANGAGKTTPLKAISNLLHAERGEVTKGNIQFDGEEVQSLPPNDLVRR
ncbi:MAG: ATP-binding cassette domain-containing protein, partial [Caldilineaceae bacterium]|nr:ATP-binding cassette domain-containing protein [Caldilineaceae bacterium]